MSHRLVANRLFWFRIFKVIGARIRFTCQHLNTSWSGAQRDHGINVDVFFFGLPPSLSVDSLRDPVATDALIVSVKDSDSNVASMAE